MMMQFDGNRIDNDVYVLNSKIDPLFVIQFKLIVMSCVLCSLFHLTRATMLSKCLPILLIKWKSFQQQSIFQQHVCLAYLTWIASNAFIQSHLHILGTYNCCAEFDVKFYNAVEFAVKILQIISTFPLHT